MSEKYKDHENQEMFKNRLWNLMQRKDKNLDTARKLATCLYDGGYIQPQRKAEDEPYRMRSNAIGTLEKRIRAHLNAETPDKLQGEFVRAYCDYFGCSADYLFGRTDIKTGNIEIRQVCEKTGLSEDAVTMLFNMTNKKYTFHNFGIYPSEAINILNRILCSQGLLNIIYEFQELEQLHLEFSEQYKKAWDDLYNCYPQEIIRQAEELEGEHLQGESEIDISVLEAINALEDTLEKIFEYEDRYGNQIKVEEYQLSQQFHSLIKELYPDNSIASRLSTHNR